MGEYAEAQLEYFMRYHDYDIFSNYRKPKRKNVMSDSTTLTFRGEMHWAKVLGGPVLNYDKNGKEWTFDFIPNDPEAARAELKALGVADRLRSKEGHLDGRPYMTFKQKELKADGKPNDPIEIVDIIGDAWDQNKLIGNGTIADVRFVVVDFGAKRYKGMYPRNVRILEHVPYERKVFNDLDPNDEFYNAAKAAEEAKKEVAMLSGNSKVAQASRAPSDEELNDDIPL